MTIESVLILDARTPLVINDNNYPGTGGRDINSDNTEFLKIRNDHALDWIAADEEDDGDDDHDAHGPH